MAQVLHDQLTMDPADLKWFASHLGTDRCFPAQLEMNGVAHDVWVGYRGRYSRMFRKPSYDIWYADGRSPLHFNATYRDPSLLRGRLSLETFADLGVPAPKAWHSWLTMNGRNLGVYTAIESLDAGWLRRRGTPPGSIYYGVGCAGNFGLTHPDTGVRKENLAAGYEKVFPHDEEFTDLEELLLQVTLPGPAEFEAEIDQHVDVDRVLRWLIGIEFMSHTDGLVQNYALFRPAGGKWQLSPWDLDGTWGRVPSGTPYGATELPVGTGDGNYLIARLMLSRRWWNHYLSLWQELLDGPLAPDRINSRVSQIYREIRTHAMLDYRKRYADSTFAREPALIRRYVTERTAFIRNWLQEWRAGRSLPGATLRPAAPQDK